MTLPEPFRRILSCLRLLAVLFIAGSLTGCLKALVIFGYLIGGPPSIEPDFDSGTGMSMTEKEVTVAVLCYVPHEVKYSFADVDHELAKFLTLQLSRHKIHVVSSDKVRQWLDEHPEWDEPEELGRDLKVTYVIYVDLEKFTLYAENSSELFQGRAEGSVSVYKMDEEGDSEKVYTKEIVSKFPLLAPRSTYETSRQTFRLQYLARLSEEIGRMFYEHYAGDDVNDAT